MKYIHGVRLKVKQMWKRQKRFLMWNQSNTIILYLSWTKKDILLHWRTTGWWHWPLTKKVMERLVLAHLRAMVCPSEDHCGWWCNHLSAAEGLLLLWQCSLYYALQLLKCLQYHQAQTNEGQTAEQMGHHLGQWVSDRQTTFCEITELYFWSSDQ